MKGRERNNEVFFLIQIIFHFCLFNWKICNTLINEYSYTSSGVPRGDTRIPSATWNGWGEVFIKMNILNNENKKMRSSDFASPGYLTKIIYLAELILG